MPGVGENLQDHLQLRMAFKVKNVVTLNQRVNSLFGKAAMGLEYAAVPLRAADDGAEPAGRLHALVARSTPRPNVEIHTQPLSLDKFGDPLHPFNAFTSSICNLRPTSRGYVRIKSPDPRAAPAINSALPEHRRGPHRSRSTALRLTRRIAPQPALAPFQPEEFVPGSAVRRATTELVQAAGNIGTTIFHPVSTCRMGRADDPTAVVDARLRVRGLGRLRIVDASIMPTITSGNTNSPTLMIAEKAAAMIREDRRAAACSVGSGHLHSPLHALSHGAPSQSLHRHAVPRRCEQRQLAHGSRWARLLRPAFRVRVATASGTATRSMR